jgi:glycosyltransferase involved in cell wall biosynthesis
MKNSFAVLGNSKKKIAFIGPFKFPGGGAESYRALGIAQSLRDAGHDVHFCTGQLSQFSFLNTTGFVVNYINLSQAPLARRSKVAKYLFSGYRTVKWLEKLLPKPDVVLMFGGYSLYAIAILPWCKRNDVPLIVDIVEWFEPSHLPGGRWSPFRLNIEMALRHFYARAGNIISISWYLEQYYQNKGCRTLRIPPTLDVASIFARTTAPSLGPLNLAYTGVPGKKDLLNNVLESVMCLDSSGKIVTLTVAGPTPDEIIQLPAMSTRGITKLPDCVRALGRVSREEALNIVRQADFSVLLRPQLRYANAGFPTKIPESLSVGTPVMCNLTSDLGEHISDTSEAFTEALIRALALTPLQRQEMRLAARKQAESSFDFRNYTNSLSNFLDEICP